MCREVGGQQAGTVGAGADGGAMGRVDQGSASVWAPLGGGRKGGLSALVGRVLEAGSWARLTQVLLPLPGYLE